MGQHCQLGLGARLGGEAEHPLADGRAHDARADLVDDARGLMAKRLRELHRSIRPLRFLASLALTPAARTAIRI